MGATVAALAFLLVSCRLHVTPPVSANSMKVKIHEGKDQGVCSWAGRDSVRSMGAWQTAGHSVTVRAQGSEKGWGAGDK